MKLRLEQVAESIDESRVDVTLTLAAGTGYSVGEGSEARVSIYYPPATVPESGIESSPTPTPSASPPDAPSGAQVSATATDSLTVTWTAEAGETYRLEREAAYLFTYRVWQTVAEDLSGGSFSNSGLACSFSYLYEIRAKVTGSVYGVGAQAFARAQACASNLSEDAAARARQAGALGKPPAPRVVTDNPTATSIQIRFWHGQNPVSGIRYFETERTLPYSNDTPPNPWPSTSFTDQHPGSFEWGDLECSKHYFFRARGFGNGEPGGWNAEFSEWSDIVHGATWACTPPTPPQVVNVVTDRPMKTSILVRWDYPPYDIGFAKFKVRYRPANDPNGWVDAGSEITDGSKRVESLTCGSSYYFQVSGKGNGSAIRLRQ